MLFPSDSEFAFSSLDPPSSPRVCCLSPPHPSSPSKISGRRRSRDGLPPMDAAASDRRVVTHYPMVFRGRAFTVVDSRMEEPPFEVRAERYSRMLRRLSPTFGSGRSCKRARVSASGDAILSLQEARTEDAGTPAECAVCLLDFVAEDKLRAMPCSHTFHQDCIFRWLQINHVCPLCRHELPTQQHDDEVQGSDDDGDYEQDEFFQAIQQYYGDDIDQLYSGEQIYRLFPEDRDQHEAEESLRAGGGLDLDAT